MNTYNSKGQLIIGWKTKEQIIKDMNKKKNNIIEEIKEMENEVTNIEKKIKNISKKSSGRKEARNIMKNIKECQSCGSKRRLEVHHKDRNPLNNHIRNIIKLCCICHYEIHKDEPIGKLMLKRIEEESLFL